MRFLFIVAVLVLPLKSYAFKWDQCKKGVYKPIQITPPQSKDIGSAIFEMSIQFTSAASFQASTSSTSYVSSTGACRAFAMAEEERYHYVAETQTELQMEAASGQGEHVTALAELYGCKDQAKGEFARMLKTNHEKIFSSSTMNDGTKAAHVTERITGEVIGSQSLSESCNLEKI